ncbi:MAG TPA: hypothetical protein PKH09_15110, partial [Parvularculaceae bacterium]|nr:hypothetical protein [Parvularculaceae bacterium]
AALYRMGVDAWRDASLLAEADYLSSSEAPQKRDEKFAALSSLPDIWPPPTCPFTGKEALAAGVAEGPAVASLIKAAEARWIAEDFPARARAMEIFADEIRRTISPK